MIFRAIKRGHEMWSDTTSEEKGVWWYWFWRRAHWRVKFVTLFISERTIASKVKMCVTGKIWNGIREKSNQRLQSLHSVATFRPSPTQASPPFTTRSKKGKQVSCCHAFKLMGQIHFIHYYAKKITQTWFVINHYSYSCYPFQLGLSSAPNWFD